jgi:hypothetical protein
MSNVCLSLSLNAKEVFGTVLDLQGEILPKRQVQKRQPTNNKRWICLQKAQ